MVTGRFDTGLFRRCVNSFTFTPNILLDHAQTTLEVIEVFV